MKILFMARWIFYPLDPDSVSASANIGNTEQEEYENNEKPQVFDKKIQCDSIIVM